HWSSAKRQRFDLGIATGPWGSRSFIEGVGVGLFASTMSKLDARRNIELSHLTDADEKRSAVLKMLLERLSEKSSRRFRIRLDGEDASGDYILIEAMNTAYVGPNLNFAPRAVVDDGLMDVVLLTESDRRKLKSYLRGALRDPSLDPGLSTVRVHELQLAWEGFDMHIDDEVWPEKGGGFDLETAQININLESGPLE